MSLQGSKKSIAKHHYTTRAQGPLVTTQF